MSFPSVPYLHRYSSTAPIICTYGPFEPHLEALLSQKCAALDAISQWRIGLIDKINVHVKQQEDLLEKSFRNQCDHVILENNRYYQAYENYWVKHSRNDMEMRSLLDRCKALQVELVNLHFTSRETEFVDIVVFDAPNEQRESDINADKNGDSALRTKTTTDGASNPTNSQHTPPVVTPKASSSSTNPFE